MEQQNVRWAKTADEIKQIAKNQSKLLDILNKGYLIEVNLNTGEHIAGIVSGSKFGNNAGEGGVWEYYGTVTITTEENIAVELNLLDIKDVKNITTKETLVKYENAKVIQIVSGPWEINEKDAFLNSKGLERLKHMDKLSFLLAIIGSIVSIFSLVMSFSDKLTKLFFGMLIDNSGGIISTAFAADQGNTPEILQNGVKFWLNFGITVTIIICFFWSLAVMFHSQNEKSVKNASDLNKMLIGFLLGSAKSFINM